MNKIEISGNRGKMTDEFNYKGNKNDYIYLDIEKIAKKIVKEKNNEIIEEINEDTKKEIEAKIKDIKNNKEKLRKGIFELAYYAYKGATKYDKIVNDGEADVDLIGFVVHQIIEPLVDELYEQRSIDIREIKNKKTTELEKLYEYLDYLEPLDTLESKYTQDYYQHQLEQYSLQYIAQVLNTQGYYHNVKATNNMDDVIDFLKDAKDHNFGINIFVDTLEPSNYLMFHVPELECYDVYDTDLIVNAIVVDKKHLGKVFYFLECDSLDYILENLTEYGIKDCYWQVIKGDDIVCSNSNKKINKNECKKCTNYEELKEYINNH